MFAAHQMTGDKPAKPRKKPAKSPHAKTRKSWNLVVLGSFRIFLVVPKIITVCVPGRSAEIFPETYMFGTKWIILWFVWPIFLERPFFPRQWRVEVNIRGSFDPNTKYPLILKTPPCAYYLDYFGGSEGPFSDRGKGLVYGNITLRPHCCTACFFPPTYHRLSIVA